VGAAAVAEATAEYRLRLSAFRLRLFLSFSSSSLPGLTRQSMQKARLHSASTGALARGVSMDHRIKSGGDDF
jgi:hypothetical protein